MKIPFWKRIIWFTAGSWIGAIMIFAFGGAPTMIFPIGCTVFNLGAWIGFLADKQLRKEGSGATIEGNVGNSSISSEEPSVNLPSKTELGDKTT